MNEYYLLFSRSYPLLLKGTLMTAKVFFFSAILSFSLGLIFGVFSCNRLRMSWISFLIEIVTFILRAVPFALQLLIVYFVFPDILGVNLEPLLASIIALGLCSSGYVMQIIRSGINSIEDSQWEAAFSLGYSKSQSFFRIVLPQVWRKILPSCTNELESLLKSTAIVSSIGLLELTRMGMNLVSREMQPIPIYLTVAFFYLCMSSVFTFFTRSLERRITYVKY
ncbi:MAG: amino acid ABC transporter permease [Verrucomicrobia bacterium]|nr:amino acid ABC transporter permease [Verrucomicrobiota bacterium]